MENDSEDQNISSETSLIKEHERLTVKYNNERILLSEALRISQEKKGDPQSSFKEVKEGEAKKREIKVKKEKEEKDEEDKEKEKDTHKFPKTLPLDPISTNESKSDEKNVFIIILIIYIGKISQIHYAIYYINF